MFSTCSDAMKRWCKALFVVTAVFLMSPAEAYDFPLFENFEQAGSVFEIREGSGWGVAGSHGGWVNFAGDRHLDNNIDEAAQEQGSDASGDYRAVFFDFLAIPSDAPNPVLFFWYKSRLYKYGDRIYLDIHVKTGPTVHVDTKRILTRWDNTRDYYQWEKLSLDEYKGKEIKVAFRQSVSRWGRSRLFVVDNLSICSADTTDGDEDGIPDNLDYSPNGELMPSPENFTAVNSGELRVDLSWTPLDRQVHPVAGYKIYRRTEGSTSDVLLNCFELLPPETDSFSDDAIHNATSYTYKIVAISSDGQRGVTAKSNSAYVDYNLTPFPYEESFDSAEPGFAIPEDSGWAISEAHGEWDSFSGNYHLDSNPAEADQVLAWGSRHIVRATMKNRVHIPDDAENPSLSFWYKMDLRTLETDDLGHDDFWDFNDDFNFLTGLLYGDRIYVDIHFVLYRIWGDPIEMVHRYARTYTSENNTTDYIWDSIPLDLYRGTEIWVDFRKKTGCSGVGSAFVMDDFRISDQPGADDNGDGIPDVFEAPIGADKLPYVKDFKAELTDIGAVSLSWAPVAGTPPPDPKGYNIYRKTDGQEIFEKLTGTPIPNESAAWADESLIADGTYSYYLVGVSTDGVEGYPTRVLFVDVVIPPPVITAQPQSSKSVEHTPATFSLEAKGLHLTYQWKRNGEPIEGATSSSYTLSDVTLDDHDAEFSCVVSNVADSVASVTARLTVHLAPAAITVQPADKIAVERGSATFTLQATGSHLTYQWQKDGMNIPGAIAASYTLTPVPYVGYDGSAYRCVISNAWNGESHVVTSSEATLDVILAPPVITGQPGPKRVTENGPATFSVSAIGTHLTYRWQRDGIDLPGAEGPSYTIGSTGLDDNGARFRCIIENTLVVGGTTEGGVVTTQSASLFVDLAPPVIVTQPVAQTVIEREAVTFTINANGSHLSYQWQKNGADIDGATQNTLTLNPASYDDDGAVFRCIVSNAWNKQTHNVTSSEAVLDVILAPPVITLDTPATVTLEEGKSLNLLVETIGTFVTYQWHKNGSPIDGATDASLHIDAVALDDHEAKYHCVISNKQEINGVMEGGEVSSTPTTLAVNLAPPVICTQPVDQKVKERSSVSFSIEANGSHLTYAWFKKLNGSVQQITEGVTVTEENTKSTLTFAAADYEDDGALIYCVISNAWNGQNHSVTSSEVALDVELAGPVIDQDTPAEITVDEGDKLELTVAATGTFVTYQWYVDGTKIPDAISDTLTTTPIELTDNGKVYHCVISNKQEINGVMEGGEVSSTPTTLAVTLAPPVIGTQPVDQKVKERSSVSFSIEANGSHLIYAWFKKLNGSVQQITEGVTVTEENTKSTLTFAAADYEDDGTLIYCVVSNTWNGQNHSVTSSEATLDVKLAPPVIDVQPADRNADELKAASFSVTATGTHLRYQWYRGTSALAGETGDTLYLVSVSYDDNGALFSCVISNTMGEEGGFVTTREAKLIVRRIVPVITKHPEGADLNEGDKLSLSVTALGADLSYQWKKDGQAIAGATSPDFTLDSVAYADRGDYACVVSNSLYEVTSDVARVNVTKAAEPELTINVPDNMETTDSFVDLSGFASAPEAAIVRVEATNDRFPGQVFGLILHEDGSLTGEVPLAIGENHLTVTMVLAEGEPIIQTVTVTSTLSVVPVITITSPAPGTTVTEASITLSGMVRSSLSPEKIRLLFNSEVYFPTGENGEYHFSIAPVQLMEGPNTLTVVAETPYGNTSAQAIVTLDAGTGIVEEHPPEIEIHAPASGAWLTDRNFSVNGVVRGAAEITSVFVHDAPATITGSGTGVSFEHSMSIAEEAGNDLSIGVVAEDATGLTSREDFSVHYDGGPPQIEITSPELAALQDLYTVKATPFHLCGTIDEGNLSSITLNGAPVTALPRGADLWAFDVAIPLVRLEEREFVLEVTDLAGYRSSYGFRMLFDAEIAIDILAPEEGSTLTVSGTEMALEVKASTPGLGDEDQVVVSVDGGPDIPMARSGATASKTLTAPATHGNRSVTVKALTAEGTLISQQSATFEVANLDDIPVRVVRQDPENGRDGVEPNTFIAFYFNKAVEPSKITIEILETAHGPTWVAPEKGADITSMGKVAPEQVNRDREPVAGGVSSFPENTMMAFYPEKDMAYGGTVYSRVLHDGLEVHRGTFTVRPMPTLLEGFVADQFMQPVKGVKVHLKERKLKTCTNADGYYSFGFGLPASENIEGGLYTVAINPGMENLAMGTHEVLVGLTEGRLNRAEMIRVPALDTSEPFRHIVSRGGPSVLKGGDLDLDFTDADLVFPDGSEEGNVHVQFTVREQIPDPTLDLAAPHWMYALQPRGITVEGTTQLSMSMPELSGSYDYLAELGQRVLLLGYDPVSKTIIPAGVAAIDHTTKRVVSEGPCRLKSLDYIGYCPVPVELQAHLDQVVSGAVGMAELIGVIESLK